LIATVIAVLDIGLIVAAGSVAASTGAIDSEPNPSNITTTLLLRRAAFVAFFVSLLLKVLWGLQLVAERLIYKTTGSYILVGSSFFGFGVVLSGSSAAIALLNVLFSHGQVPSAFWAAMAAGSIPLYFALNLLLGSTLLCTDILCVGSNHSPRKRVLWRLCGVGAASLTGYTYAKVAQNEGMVLWISFGERFLI
jgi:hypothetical protein